MPSPDALLDLRLLGGFAVHIGALEVPPERWTRRKSHALVKLLALAPRHRLHREQVIEALWPDGDSSLGANNLNKTLLLARRALEPALESGSDSRYLQREGDHLLLSVESERIDIERFEAAARAARETGTLAMLDAAVGEYRGDLLPDDALEDWTTARREQLRVLFDDLLLRLADARTGSGDLAGAIDALERLVHRDPAAEAAHRRLMELYWCAGQRDRALRQFEACTAALERVVDASPDAATLALQRRIASGAAPPPAPATAPTAAPPVTSPEAGFFDTPALAVLPFATERGTESEYFADGLTEALIHELSEIPDVRVIARASVFHPQHANRDACNVGRDLGAAQVVCGRVRTFGAELEIDIELVRVADRVRLWGERYRHRNDALATAETEVLRDLVALLRARPATSGSRSTARRQTADAAAHRDFLRGRFFWNKRNEEALRTAIRHFRSALDRDPTYAAAYVGLADCYCLLGLYGLSPPHQTMPRAKAAAERALEIDGEFAEAFASLAYVQLYYDWDFPRAESGFQTALRLSPNYATAHHWYHELLTAQGRFTEQTEHIRRAEALDPLSAIIKTDIAWGLYFARDFAAAEQHLRDALELDPQLAVAHVLHGAVALVQGPEERAAASLHSLRRAVELGGTRFPLAIAALGFALARTGDRSGAQQALEQLDSHRAAGFVSRFYAAPILYGLGQIDRTLDALEDAVEERCDRAVFLAREPLFDRLRGEARFTNLLGRIGIA